MLPASHTIISAGLSYCFYQYSGSPSATAACFLSGIFIDLDHHLEYLIVKKEIPFDLKKLMHFFEYDRHPKVYLWFHAWEYLFFLWALIYFLSLGIFWVAIALGVTVHMICDLLANPIRPLGYFLTYRARHGFEKKDILNEEALKKIR